MPPVMGAGAFVLASYTQISYLTVIAASALPALLYFLTVSYFVRIEAKRLGLTAAEESEGESVRTVLKEGWHFVIPLGVLIGFSSPAEPRPHRLRSPSSPSSQLHGYLPAQ